jgi:hypothetical protein
VGNLELKLMAATSLVEIETSLGFIVMLIGFLNKLAGSRESGSLVMFEEGGESRQECFRVKFH